jgi:hypothetical protein
MKTKSLARLLAAGIVALAGNCSLAQSGNGTDNLDWAEDATPPPPAFSKDKLIALAMPSYVSIKVGVDPDTIAVGADGVVRYVIVMSNATGSVSAVYEGIRCVTDEVKTYARLSASGKWNLQENPVWKDVSDNMPSRHAQAFARQGACQNHLATSKREILDALKAGLKPSAIKKSF